MPFVKAYVRFFRALAISSLRSEINAVDGSPPGLEAVVNCHLDRGEGPWKM